MLLDLMQSGNARHLCPKCLGGTTGEKTFSVWAEDDGYNMLFGKCHRATCNYFVSDQFGPGAVLPQPSAFVPKPLRQPYRTVEFGLFGERRLVADPSVTVWQLYDINGRRTGHVTRDAEKRIQMFKEVPEPVYYSNGLRPHDVLWVFEDPRSAAMCPQPAVALLGTNLPISLLDHLTALSPRPVVFVALDPGAEEAGERVHARLRAAGIEAVFVPMSEDFKDMDQTDRELLLETYAR